jgi:hypothetical protein
MFYALGRDQPVGQAPHGVSRTAHGQNFHAGVVIEVHVQRGDDRLPWSC